MFQKDKKYKCIDCGKILNSNAKYDKTLRCKSCYAKLKFSIPENTANYIDGRTTKIYKCIDCGKIIDYRTWCFGTKRCKPCANKNKVFIPEKCGSYIDGRTLKTYYCIGCGKEISAHNWLYQSKKCSSCSHKNRIVSNKTRQKLRKLKLGTHLSKKTKNKISKILKGKYIGSKSWNFGKTGKLSPSYIHGKGYEPYTLEFNQRFVESIRKRDNYKCQNCGMTQLVHLKKFNQKLEVHHIDYTKSNCNPDNLLTLCKKHNLKANFNRDYWFAFYTYIVNK